MPESKAVSTVVDLPDREQLGLGEQWLKCANPRCMEQFKRTGSRGQPKRFHSEDCRRSAERDLRRLQSQLEHHEQQAQMMRGLISNYIKPAASDDASGPTPEEVQAARDVVAEIRGVARFLPGHQGEFAGDLLRLLEAVETLTRAKG